MPRTKAIDETEILKNELSEDEMKAKYFAEFEAEQKEKAEAEEKKSAEEEKLLNVMFDKQADEFGKALNKMSKKEIKIPIDQLNKESLYIDVCVNGYTMKFKRGEKIEVPEVVADILENANFI